MYAARQSQPLSVDQSEQLPCFSELHLNLESQTIPDWNLVCGSANTLQLYRMESGYDSGPPKVSTCVEIKESLEWSVYVWSKKPDIASHPLLCSQLTKLRSVDVRSLLTFIDGCKICKGNDDKFDPLIYALLIPCFLSPTCILSELLHPKLN